MTIASNPHIVILLLVVFLPNLVGILIILVSFTDGVDYIVPVDLTFEIDLSTPLQLCVSLSIIDDTLGEGMEQFEFYFVDVPSDSATIGTPATTCVNIIDDDGMYSTHDNREICN